MATNQNLAQIFATNPITTISNTDILYAAQGGTTDAGISGASLKAQFAPLVTGVVPVDSGGTGSDSVTPYAVLCGGINSTAPFQSIAALGSNGQVLTSNGPSALPTMQDAAGGAPVHFNFIYGGNFDTNPFQRYQFQTSFAPSSQKKWIADRFALETSSGSDWNAGQFADAPSFAQCGIQVSNCLQVKKTGTLTPGTAGYAQMVYAIEGLDFLYLAQSPMTLTFLVKSSVAGTYNIGLINGGQDQGYAATYTIASANTWQLVSITITTPQTGTWNYTQAGIGIYINFVMAAGTDYEVTPNVWTTPPGTQISSAGQANAFASANGVFQIALVQIEEGSSFTGFQKRSIQEEYAYCQRYYENSFLPGSYNQRLTSGDNSSYHQNGSSGIIAATNYDVIYFKVPKAQSPTMTVWSKVNNTSGSTSQISDGGDIAVSFNGFSGNRIGYNYTNNALGYGSEMYWEANAEIF